MPGRKASHLAAAGALALLSVVVAPTARAASTNSATRAAPADGQRAVVAWSAGRAPGADSVRAAGTATIDQPGHPTSHAGVPVDDPEAAVVSASADYSLSQLALSVTPERWTDPAADPDWQNAGDNTGFAFAFGESGAGRVYVVVSVPVPGGFGLSMVVDSVGASGNIISTNPVHCPGLSANFGSERDPSYRIGVPDNCFGSPVPLQWAAAMSYDRDRTDLSGQYADSDQAPEPGQPAAAVSPYDYQQGYLLFARDGGVFADGNTVFHGSLGNIRLNAPIVGGAADPATGGYWMVGADGGVFNFDAPFLGSLGAVRLNQPIVAMAGMPGGDGYWLFARDGGVFNFGHAGFYGSLGGTRLNQPVVGGWASPSGHGYTLVAADGGVFQFGDAGFYGALGNIHLNKAVVGGAGTPDGGGYWLTASDGGVFDFGDAGFYGALGNVRLNRPIVAVAASPGGGGYWLAGSDGGVFNFGRAHFEGSQAGHPLNQPVVGIVAGAGV